MKALFAVKLAAGFTALGLGAVGMLLPVWPTTPFVLVALGCFACTPRLQAKIMKIRFFREYYESYTHKQALSVRTLVVSLCFLWGMLTLSMLALRSLPLTLLLLGIGLAITAHIGAVSRIKLKRHKQVVEERDETP